MPRGGARPGAGRKPKTPKVDKPAREPHAYTAANGEKTADAPKDWPFGKDPDAKEPEAPQLSFATPLEYWQYVLQNPAASASAKQTAAYSMAPYIHAKVAPAAKKEEAKGKAKKAAIGKFASQAAPRLAAAHGKRV